MTATSTPKDVRRPISLKIFGIAIALLLLMIIVTLSSSISLYRLGEELTLLSELYIRLDQEIGDIRAQCLREVIMIERVLNMETNAAAVDMEGPAKEQIEALFKEAGDCDPDSLRPAIRKLRKAYPDRSERQLMIYRLIRLCSMRRLENVNRQIDQALALEQVRDDPGHIQRLSTIKVQIASILPQQAKLQASFEKYMKQVHGKNETALDLMQERIDEHRREVTRSIRRVSEALHDGTRESADRARELKIKTLWLGWSVTVVACALGLIFAGIITRNLVRPVRELLSHTNTIRTGNLDVNIQINTADEIGLLADSFRHMVGELKQKEMIKRLFGKYVDPRIVQVLLQGKQQLAQGGERQLMSVFFSDIEGFTSICEDLTPTGIVRLLNLYFSIMAEPIRVRKGIIDKYIGDSVMAFWGPPFTSSEEHATLACLAALDQRALLPQFHGMLPELMGSKNVPIFSVRMGIATGDVTVGSIGSEEARSYTVIGDTVNLGSRMEGANKHYNTEILICERTRSLAGQAIEAREVDTVRFVGKTDPVRVYELLGTKDKVPPKTMELSALYEQGLAFYRKRMWEEARGEFKRCLEINPDDGPSQVLVERIDLLEGQALTESWDGVWSLPEK